MLEKYIKSFMSICHTETTPNIIKLIETNKINPNMDDKIKDTQILKSIIGKKSMYKILYRMNGGSGIKLYLNKNIKK